MGLPLRQECLVFIVVPKFAYIEIPFELYRIDVPEFLVAEAVVLCVRDHDGLKTAIMGARDFVRSTEGRGTRTRHLVVYDLPLLVGGRVVVAGGCATSRVYRCVCSGPLLEAVDQGLLELIALSLSPCIPFPFHSLCWQALFFAELLQLLNCQAVELVAPRVPGSNGGPIDARSLVAFLTAPRGRAADLMRRDAHEDLFVRRARERMVE